MPLDNVHDLSTAVNFVYGRGKRIPLAPPADADNEDPNQPQVCGLDELLTASVHSFLDHLGKPRRLVDLSALACEKAIYTHRSSFMRAVERLLSNALNVPEGAARQVTVSSCFENGVARVTFWDDSPRRFTVEQVAAINAHQPIPVGEGERQRGSSGRGTLFIQRYCEIHESFQTSRLPRYRIEADQKRQVLEFPTIEESGS